MVRIAVASIMQETNTFALGRCSLSDFRFARGRDVLDLVAGTNSELARAQTVIEAAGGEVIPLLYAWAMPAGRVDGTTFRHLRDSLADALGSTGSVDALVLSLHGSMAAEGFDDADGELLRATRAVVGETVPIAVTLDLHANVTREMVRLADSISAYHTDPHIDMADAGARAARRALAMAAGSLRPVMGFAKRPMLVPGETMNTSTGPLSSIRRQAMAAAPAGLLELGLFPVQPWLDVPELGFGVVAVADGSEVDAADAIEQFAAEVATAVWARRHEFRIDRLSSPLQALATAAMSRTRPFLIAESADAPTAGAAGDSPAMVRAVQEAGGDLVAYVPVVDATAVEACHNAGLGHHVRLRVGASIDHRWWEPVDLQGVVAHLGDGTYRLEGASFTGMEVSMGRFATVHTGPIRLLLSERPAWTSDPATFRIAGLPPEDADVIVVRSCSDFLANFPGAAAEAVTLDVPGAATPRLENLTFAASPRAPFPLDDWAELDA